MEQRMMSFREKHFATERVRNAREEGRTETSAWEAVVESRRELTWPCRASQVRRLAARPIWRATSLFSGSAPLSAAGSALRLTRSRLALMICSASHCESYGQTHSRALCAEAGFMRVHGVLLAAHTCSDLPDPNPFPAVQCARCKTGN